MRRYVTSGGAAAGLYLLNRFLLVPLTGWRLLAWHGADFLAGGLMLCLLNGLLLLARRRPVERFLPCLRLSPGLRPVLGGGDAPVPAPVRGGPVGRAGGVAGGRWPCWPSGGRGTGRDTAAEIRKNRPRRVCAGGGPAFFTRRR